MPSSAARVTAQNTARQPDQAITALPTKGARIGETLNTNVTSDINRAAAGPVWRSRAIASGMTIPAHAPIPSKYLKKISVLISGARAQPTLLSAKRRSPA